MLSSKETIIAVGMRLMAAAADITLALFLKVLMSTANVMLLLIVTEA